MKKLFSIKNSLIIMFLFFITISIATFVENKYSKEIAWEMIYSSMFFELFAYIIILALSTNIVFSKMYKKKRISALFIHISVIFIIVGALVTKYYSFQGEIYISEKETKSSVLSRKYYMQVEARKNDKTVSFIKEGNKKFSDTFDIFGKPLTLTNKYYEKHILQNIVPFEKGKGVISFEILAKSKRDSYMFDGFGRLQLDNLEIVFNLDPRNKNKPYFKIVANESMMIHFISNAKVITNFGEELKKDTVIKFNPGIIYSINGVNLLADDIITLAKVETIRDEKQEGQSALFADMKYNHKPSKEMILLQQDKHYSSYANTFYFDGIDIKVNWKKLETTLPFKIKLNKFDIERYYGSNVISSYESNVTLVDINTKKESTHNIKINEPLTFASYTIFQTKNKIYNGTIFYVNYNPAKWLIYLGYLLLTLGLIINLFNPNSRFLLLGKK